jgi:NAD(P)-dependent dehydrogenase (short-subunit alcohol dehydrogenase family)
MPLPDLTKLFRLDGEIAVVTGAARGIGRAASTVLAQAGATVVLTDRDADACVSTARALADDGLKAEAVTLDVMDDAAVAAAFAAIAQRHRRFDVLINNAGTAIRQPALEVTREAWDTTIGLNVTACFVCAREAARQMIAAGKGGRVVNTASIMGFSGGGLYPNPAYQTSKGAVVNMTRALAVEWGPQKVRVNAIAPTWVRTDLTRPLFANNALVGQLEATMPLGRACDPEDLAGAILYLSSRASDMVTGHILAVDGGFLAK